MIVHKKWSYLLRHVHIDTLYDTLLSPKKEEIQPEDSGCFLWGPLLLGTSIDPPVANQHGNVNSQSSSDSANGRFFSYESSANVFENWWCSIATGGSFTFANIRIWRWNTWFLTGHLWSHNGTGRTEPCEDNVDVPEWFCCSHLGWIHVAMESTTKYPLWLGNPSWTGNFIPSLARSGKLSP